MKLSYFLFAYMALLSPFAAAEEPFAVAIERLEGGQLLKIHLERLSRDEVEHFMQKMVISRNGEDRIEESLINQNHLNEITKYIPFASDVGDTIGVTIVYGNQKTFSESLTVTQAKPSSSSRIIQDKVEGQTDDPATKKSAGSRSEPDRVPTSYGYRLEGDDYPPEREFGYEKESIPMGYEAVPEREYGEPGFGYSRDDSNRDGRFGYDRQDRETMDPLDQAR